MYFGEWWWNFSQDRQIAENTANTARVQTRVQIEQERLDARMDAMILANAAMWELVRERLGVTDRQLLDKMQEIDLRDGIRDGRVAPPTRPCPKCGRPVGTRRTVCLYCGEQAGLAGPFDGAR